MALIKLQIDRKEMDSNQSEKKLKPNLKKLNSYNMT